MIEAEAETVRPKKSLWKHADFLKLWSAQAISVTGDQFSYLAIPLIATLTLGATATQMGYLTALGTAPFLLISLFAGIWVDRLPRRPILFASDFGRALILFSIPLAAFSHSLRMSQLYAVEFLIGVLSVFFEIAYQAILPSLVDKHSLVDGNTKLAATSSLAGLIGPSLAGVMIQVASAPAAIALDACSFLCSGGLISLVRRRETHGEETKTAPMLTDVREGLAFVFGSPLLRAIAGSTATFNFFYLAQLSLYIIFATRQLGLSPARIGLILGLGNVAGLLGAVRAGWLSTRLRFGRTVIGSLLLSGLAIVPIIFATPRSAFWLLLISRLLLNFGLPVFNINQISLRQSITPHRLQGRMTGTMRFLVWGTMPLGGLVGGFLGEYLGLRTAIAIAATGTALAVLWIVFSPLRSLRTIPEPVD